MTPKLLRELDETQALELLRLIHRAFAGIEGHISPTSSLHRLTLADLRSLPATDALCVIGQPPIACAIFRQRDEALYVEKLAVDPANTRQGFGRAILDVAKAHATLCKCTGIRVQTRVELSENHRFFEVLGFQEIARTAHPGFTQPTSITYEKPL